jgi:heptosyltransferase III
MGPRAAVFCHNGLGDGVISLVLSNNLHLNGWQVDTYQNFIGSMQNWFPHLPVISYPPMDEIERVLHQYEWFFVFHNDTSEFIQKLIAEGKRRFPDQIKVIYAYPSRRIVREIYYQDSQIDPDLSLADSLRIFCENILLLPKSTRSNGFIPPVELRHRVNKKRVLIHPTSSRTGKNWTKEKFVDLAAELFKQGYAPEWIVGPKERNEWDPMKGDFAMPEFSTLDLLANYIYESGYLVGNDSGMGHLASFLEIPTLTITRRRALAKLWAPSYAAGIIVTPHSWIPNIRGFRLRDRHWQKFISTQKVLRAFQRLVEMN